MQVILIPKKSGGVRTIYAPNRTEKRAYRRRIPELNLLLEKHCRSLPCHGFMPHRSPVTNARAHIGFQWSLSFDLKDFFDTVDAKHLQGIVPENLIQKLLYDGAARQGLPTSPLLANLAAAEMDRRILQMLPAKCVYTRYADDLTFSDDDRAVLEAVKVWLPQVVAECRFKLNEKKTRLQSAKFGRRIITGVAVDATSAYPTRSVRRRLRAALHQGHQAEAKGLVEWCRLKLPGVVSNRQKLREYRKVQRALRKAGK